MVVKLVKIHSTKIFRAFITFFNVVVAIVIPSDKYLWLYELKYQTHGLCELPPEYRVLRPHGTKLPSE
jgi:hypothetical protein